MTWSDASLDAARGCGDEAADRLVAQLGGRVWQVNALLRGVRRNDDPLPASLPGEVRELFATAAALPPWVDRTRILAAQSWAQRHLLHITLALFGASLPSTYAAARGARVLLGTGRMQGDLDRRVNETARFVLDILRPGALDPSGSALVAIRKVRLIHAAVRALVPSLEPGEVPINQEDLLGTLLGFSVVVIRAMRRMGVEIAPGSAEDFYQLWRSVAVVIGLRDDMIPRDLTAANRAADRIAARQFRASPHGRALMASLLARMVAHVDVPGLRASPQFLVRYLLGERTAELLGIPAANESIARALSMRGLGRITSRLVFGQLVPLVGRRLLDSVITVKLQGAPVHFDMPAPGL
jgi:hypothetical protein